MNWILSFLFSPLYHNYFSGSELLQIPADINGGRSFNVTGIQRAVSGILTKIVFPIFYMRIQKNNHIF